MPGGSAFRKWYAMRDRLRREGKWYGDKPPGHSVPGQEEGEPPPKVQHYDGGPDAWKAPAPIPEPPFPGNRDVQRVPRVPTPGEDSDEPPPLEASPTPEGKNVAARPRLFGTNLVQTRRALIAKYRACANRRANH